MARPIEFNKTKALDAAMDTFWTNGYERTSLQDLIDSMALSKSSFYNSFGSKHELFTDSLRSYSNMMSIDLQRRLDAAGSGRVFLERLLSEIVDTSTEESSLRGCFLLNTATEFAQCNKEVSELTRSGLNQFHSVFRKAIEQAREAGEVRSDEDPDRLAWFVFSGVIGLKTMVKAGVDKPTLNAVSRSILSSFN